MFRQLGNAKQLFLKLLIKFQSISLALQNLMRSILTTTMQRFLKDIILNLIIFYVRLAPGDVKTISAGSR